MRFLLLSRQFLLLALLDFSRADTTIIILAVGILLAKDADG